MHSEVIQLWEEEEEEVEEEEEEEEEDPAGWREPDRFPFFCVTKEYTLWLLQPLH